MASGTLTYDDLLRIPFDGLKHEIIDGVHYATEAHYTKEQRVVARLKSLLHARLLPNFFYEPGGWTNAVMGIVSDAGVRELVIEVVFPGAREAVPVDRTTVSEYWLITPATDSVVVFRREGDHLAPADVTDPVTSPRLPGFSLPLGDLFA